ncbi:MAG: TetR/AcrR family transcriptional regulator [Alphaproteobacteria bacterium]|nr:TetR/AcrR family transcriptional regulator [Alphaproteobacteria bacterium]MBF0393208.1 TetR/AcrR family transcriptional regulator [Alphaproteobacteria bacterium]
MEHGDQVATAAVYDRLLAAAKNCFLADDFHNVSTRRIAEEANVNVSMIRYYFGNKEGLYEEMIRHTLSPLLEVLDGQMLSSLEGFTEYLCLYYRTMLATPEFPRLILKVLALKHGPGRRFIQQLLERGRSRGAKRVNEMKHKGLIGAEIDPDVLRLSFVSLAITPMLLKEVFEEQIERPLDDTFLETLARFNGRLIAAGLASLTNGCQEDTP